LKKIKLFDPFTSHDEQKAILKVLKSHFWASGAGGIHVNLFEKKFGRFVGSESCIAVNSGTAALHLALSLYDLRDKEVILPSLSFVSTAHAILYNGAKPVFVDVDPITLCLDPSKVKEKINKNTGAILPVHFGGMACNLNEFYKICKKHNLVLIEDAAHAAGAKYKGKPIGSHGNAVCFSFHPVKNLAMPTGGAICLNGKSSTKHNMKKLESLRWCGISNRVGSKYDVSELGWNYYMNEFSASVGLEQLKKLEKTNSIRRKIAKRYFKELKTHYKMSFNKECSYHLYWILVKNRSKFRKILMEKSIETGTHYKPIHSMSFYKKNLNLPITNGIGTEIVTLPIHPNLTDSDIDKIIKFVNKFT